MATSDITKQTVEKEPGIADVVANSPAKKTGKFNIKDEEDFNEVKADAEAFYATLSEVYCPYFKEKIAFNAKGLRHLKFKSDQVARVQKDQYARLKLLKYVPTVIQNSRTLQGIRETRQFETQKTNSRWEKVLKDVVTYEFIAIIENLRIKVLVKQIVGGEKYFWSVIPYWGIDRVNSKRILHNMTSDED
jgi:hypothetical protein